MDIHGRRSGPVAAASSPLEPRARRARVFGSVILVYRQVAAVAAAIGLAAMLSQIAHLDWHSWVGTVIGYWDHYVRPATAFATDVLVAPLGRAFGWHIELPLPVRDYLSVGLIMLLSTLRADSQVRSTKRRWRGRRVLDLLDDARIAVQLVVLWPVYLLLYLLALFVGVGSLIQHRFWPRTELPPRPGAVTVHDMRRATRAFALSVAPLGYFELLFIIDRYLS